MSYEQAKQHAPIDENVKLPAAIRAASNRASEIHKAAYEPDDPNQPEPVKSDKDAPKDDPKTKSKPKDKQDGSTEGEPKKADPEAGKEAQGREEPGTPPSAGDDWEHKYKSLKPRFDRQAQQLNEQNQRLMHLERLVATRTEQPAQQPTPDLKFKTITEEERETYGEDFLDVSARAAAQRLNPRLAELQAEIDRLKNQQEQLVSTTVQSSRQSMYGELDRQVPNWKEINRSPDFIAWVNEEDAFSGVPRMKMLQEAFDKNETNRVIRFFTGFLADEAATDPVVHKPETPKNEGKVPLAEFAAPGRAKAPAASTPPGEKETITHANIAQFYADVQRGKYRGNEKEKDRIERMIFQAQNEGRVA